jgi:hypothetical protein
MTFLVGLYALAYPALAPWCGLSKVDEGSQTKIFSAPCERFSGKTGDGHLVSNADSSPDELLGAASVSSAMTVDQNDGPPRRPVFGSNVSAPSTPACARDAVAILPSRDDECAPPATRSTTPSSPDDASTTRISSSLSTAATSVLAAARPSHSSSRSTTSTVGEPKNGRPWGVTSTSPWREAQSVMTFVFFATTAIEGAGSMEGSVRTLPDPENLRAPWCGPSKITGYLRTDGPYTYDGTPTYTKEPIVAASWDVKMGSLATIEGLGTFRVADRGMLGNGIPMPWVDVAVWHTSEAYALTGIRRVCFRPPSRRTLSLVEHDGGT